MNPLRPRFLASRTYRLTRWTLPAQLLLVVSAFLMASCGGSDPAETGSSSLPTPTGLPAPPSTASSSTQSLLRLYEAASIFASVASASLDATTVDNAFWTVGPCVFGSGSLRIALDGAPLTAKTALPTGTHSVAVDFDNCLVDGLVGSSLRGYASATYSSSDFQTVSAEVSATALHAELYAYRSDMYRVTAEGSGTSTRTRTNDGEARRFVPNANARLTNESTTRVATFGGGSYTSRYFNPPSGVSAVVREEFDNLVLTIDGTVYVLAGHLQASYGFVGNQATYFGEVQVTNQGNLVARVYGDFSGALRMVVLAPLAVL